MLYPVELRLEARDNATGSFGEEVTFDLVLLGDVPLNITAVHFDLLHNNDLLSFVDMNTVGLTLDATNGHAEQRQRFTLTNKQAGVIGTLTFRTFLASASSTTVRFENIRLDSVVLPLPADCIALFSDSSASFTYTNTCGDPLLREYLTSDAILVSSVSPNPAGDEISIDLDTKLSSMTQEGERMEAILSDAMGREVCRWSVTNGTNRIGISHIPSGMYYLAIRSAYHAKVHRVVIHR